MYTCNLYLLTQDKSKVFLGEEVDIAMLGTRLRDNCLHLKLSTEADVRAKEMIGTELMDNRLHWKPSFPHTN